MTYYLIDNSVWARLESGDPAIVERMGEIECSPSDLVVTCPPQVLELCHSARTSAEHERYREKASLGFELERTPDESLVLSIQSALWNAGLVRAAGPLDILIAAYAILNDVTVLSADHDFTHIASVTELQHEYIAPSN